MFDLIPSIHACPKKCKAPSHSCPMQSPNDGTVMKFDPHTKKFQPVEKGISLRQNNFLKFLRYACLFLIVLTTEEKIRSRSGRAGPSFSARPEKEAKGAVCTAHRQRKDSATIKTVRRDAQKLAASRRSNNLCARFFTARDAMKKSPHEPRSQILRALPRPSGSCLTRSQRRATQGFCNLS